MIFEVKPEAYDAEGLQVGKPNRRKHCAWRPTFPLGLYVKRPLTITCEDLDEVKAFLRTCRYVPDFQQFDRLDYWFPPDEFEKARKGDCEDFALWTWRQLMNMGYQARFVTGKVGWLIAMGHAWVTFAEDGRVFIVEATTPRWRWRPYFLRHSYHPDVSVEWDGKRIKYYEHERRGCVPQPLLIIPFTLEWLLYCVLFGPLRIIRLHLFLRRAWKWFKQKKRKDLKKLL